MVSPDQFLFGRSDPAQVFTTPAWAGQLPKLHVYVDETGDRGFGPKASSFFAMTALLVPDESEWWMRAVAGGLRSLINTAKPLHWCEHFTAKRLDRRSQASDLLARVPGVQLQHVIAHKRTIREDAGMRDDKDRFYNYVSKLLLERVALAAKCWPGGSRLAIVRLGSVKHMDHNETRIYLDRMRSAPTGTSVPIPWEHIKWPPKWIGMDLDGLQIADLHAGMLNAALTGASEDQECARHLLACSHQLRRSPRGKIMGYGIKVLGDNNYITGRCWWDSMHGPGHNETPWRTLGATTISEDGGIRLPGSG